MKKTSLRSFGIACFVIGLFISFSQNTGLPFISQTEGETDQQYKAKIIQLEQQLNKANEQLSILKQDNQTEETTKEVMSDEKMPEKEDSSTENAVSTEITDEKVSETLYIYAGLTPAEIAQKLKDMKIITNSVEMELFLAQPEYATSIQKGQFQLDSSMSKEEIANIITGRSRIE